MVDNKQQRNVCRQCSLLLSQFQVNKTSNHLRGVTNMNSFLGVGRNILVYFIFDRCLCAISMKASRARRCLVRNELTTVIAGPGRQCYFHMPLTGLFKREARSFEQFLILAPSYNCKFSCMCNRKYLNGFIWPSMLLSYATDLPFQKRGKKL